MRATVMFGAGDVRVETVPDASIVEQTDALVRVTRACICGSDLWPYEAAQRLFASVGFRRTMIEMTRELDDPAS